jgi:hypothetical protein
MNIRIMLIACILTAMVGLFGGSHIASTIAQDDPSESGFEVEGATFEFLAAGVAPTLPQAPALVHLARARIAPGGHITVPADDPGTALIWVETGVMSGYTTDSVSIMRAALSATPEAQPFEEVAANVEFTAGAGDSFVGKDRSGGEFRNDGTEELVLWIAGVEPDTSATPAS